VKDIWIIHELNVTVFVLRSFSNPENNFRYIILIILQKATDNFSLHHLNLRITDEHISNMSQRDNSLHEAKNKNLGKVHQSWPKIYSSTTLFFDILHFNFLRKK